MNNGKCNIGDLVLDSGEILPEVQISYTTYGTYTCSRNSSNAIIIFHALTGNTNAAEWWSGIIGKDKSIDPAKNFIICCNSLGSCYGSTGAENTSFPKITIRDIARSQILALEQLGIEKAQLGIGGSMGAMVLLELAVQQPNFFDSIVSIACGASHTAWRIAFSSVIRKTIEAFGNDKEASIKGMKLARQFAMISYRSSDEFQSRFGRTKREGTFEVEHYLDHHSEKIAERFSPYSYLRLTEAMETFDLCEGRSSDLRETLSPITADVLCIGIDSDILYPESEITALADSFVNGRYATLSAPFGHDSFLVAQEWLASLLSQYR